MNNNLILSKITFKWRMFVRTKFDNYIRGQTNVVAIWTKPACNKCTWTIQYQLSLNPLYTSHKVCNRIYPFPVGLRSFETKFMLTIISFPSPYVPYHIYLHFYLPTKFNPSSFLSSPKFKIEIMIMGPTCGIEMFLKKNKKLQ